MMDKTPESVGKYAYCQLDVDKHGRVKPGMDGNDGYLSVRQFVKEKACTDLIIVSHGFHTGDTGAAHAFYEKFFQSASSEAVQHALGDRLANRQVAVLGVAWPSGGWTDPVAWLDFWEMKARAGLVGKGAVSAVSHNLLEEFPNLKIHLIGHSLGARVMILAAIWPAFQFEGHTFASMTLIEPAVSRHIFAKDFDDGRIGYYRSLVESNVPIKGPIVVMFSHNDVVLKVAYQAAIMDAALGAGRGDTPSAFSPDPTVDKVREAMRMGMDLSGALGCNGATYTPEAADVTMGDVGHAYDFTTDHVINLDATKHIPGHTDIHNHAVAYACLYAATTV
jgi:hypothetical protein